MNEQDKRSLRQFVVNVVHNRSMLNEKKVDVLVAYMNSVLKKYEIQDKFDTIEIERDRNIRHCCSRVSGCFSKCNCFVQIFKWTAIFVILISLFFWLIVLYLLRFSSTTAAV